MNLIAVLVPLLSRPSAAWTAAVVLGSLGAWLAARAYARPSRPASAVDAPAPTDPLALWDLGQRTGRWAPFLGRALELLGGNDGRPGRSDARLRSLARLQRSHRRAELADDAAYPPGPGDPLGRGRTRVDRALARAAPSAAEGPGP